jgi:4-hydroxy-tetrahydrodipicolinate reductase
VDGGDLQHTDDLDAGISASDVVIDCSTPETALLAAKCAAQNQKPILICTTGIARAQLTEMRELAGRIPMAVIANTSLGVFALSQLAAQAATILGPSFDVEIFELHHRGKKDAPSGTALALAAAVQSERPLDVCSGASGQRGIRGKQELGVEALRGGDVAGEHTVFFLGEGERIELTHRVSDRAVFARGALRLVTRLSERAPGFYSIQDLIRNAP